MKLRQDPRVTRCAYRVRIDSDGVPRKLLQVGKAFVGYRDEEPSFAGLSWCSVMDRQAKARILIEPTRKLSQQKKLVGQNGKAKEAKDERCD